MADPMFLSITDLTDDKGTPRPGTVVIDGVAYVLISDFSFSVANAGAVIVGVAAGQSQLQLNPLRHPAHQRPHSAAAGLGRAGNLASAGHHHRARHPA